MSEEEKDCNACSRDEAKSALTWMEVMNAAARPFMTIMFATTYTIVCTLAWYRKDTSAEAYMNAIGPIVATLVGFWFGERAANGKDDRE